MNQIFPNRLAPRTAGGLSGTALVAALYVAHALLLKWRGQGLGAVWLLLLLLPGAVAAYICLRRGIQYKAAQEGVWAGVITAHAAAAIQVIWLVWAVATTDWEAYARAVGPEIAYAVRDMAAPATALAIALGAALTYAGCAGASWLGALMYTTIRDALAR